MKIEIQFKDKDYQNILERMCEKYNLNVHKDNERKFSSCVAGNDIWIGDYEGDEELMLISFFHEFGHTQQSFKWKQDTNFNTLLIEIECWNIGIAHALEHFRLVFSDKAIKWGYEQALTYAGHDEREVTNWKFKKIL